MLEEGLPRVHVRKPGMSKEELRGYIEQIAPHYRRRLVVHDHHILSSSLKLGGIHYREADIPEGSISEASGDVTTSLSYHHLKQLLICKGAVDYCFLSPIFPSLSKSGYSPLGDMADFDNVSSHVLSARSPVVALGGAQ